MLLGNVKHIFVVRLFGESTLRRSVCSESPARATATLILHFVHVAVCRVVDLPQFIGQASSIARSQLGQLIVVILGHIEGCKILFSVPICCEISFQDEIIRIVRVLLMIVGIDHVDVFMECLLSLLEILHRRVLFAVHGGKLHEIGVLREQAEDA